MDEKQCRNLVRTSFELAEHGPLYHIDPNGLNPSDLGIVPRSQNSEQKIYKMFLFRTFHWTILLGVLAFL